MTSCHDPYRELEIYLEKAQEEICKAFEELLEHEKNTSSLENQETVLPPPPAFRSPSRSRYKSNRLEKIARDELDSNTVSRVCYDGNVLNLRSSVSRYSSVNRSPYLLQKSFSCPADELHFSKTGNGTREGSNEKLLADGGLTLSNHGRPFPKPLRPSFSFPEGAIDSFLREKVLQTETKFNGNKNTSQFQTDSTNVSSDGFQRSQHLNSTSCDNGRPRVRLRSFSGLSSVDPMLPTDEQYHTFPRPPSGDVNLLSIWADNLVLAVDRSLSEELDDSVGSPSPLSDYSPSPSKHEEENNCGPLSPVETGRKALPGFDEDDSLKDNSIISQQSRSLPTSLINNLKQVTPSPDSGVCGTPDAGEDVVDFVRARDHVGFDNGLSLSLKIDLLQDSDSFDITHCLTPPPPEFEDKDDKRNAKFGHMNYPSYISEFSETHNETTHEETEPKMRVNWPILTAASNIAFVSDDILEEQSVEKVCSQARALPAACVDMEECSTVTTVCVTNDAPSRVRHVVSRATSTDAKCRKSDAIVTISPVLTSSHVHSSSDAESKDNEGSKRIPDVNVQVENATSASTLPKSSNRANENDRYSCSLPRDAGRVPSGMSSDSPQRSSSSSAVSSISQVSVDELAAFMRKVKKSTYHPPPRADVCIDAKDDNDQDSFLKDESNCDAVTQTTPVVPLSRSSSFTWITDCDCSDWDSPHARSISEDSLLVFSCSNSDPEKKEVQTSSSLSSSVDDDAFDVPQNSGCSSLYLSACSEANDSLASDSSPPGSDKQEPDASGESLQDEQCIANEESSLGPPVPDLAASESIKSLSSVGTLVDIAEESPTNETLSFCSMSSNSDPIIKDQPASFPSTLKSQSRNRICESDMYRHQPIEANVLIVNELNVKSVSAPVLRQKRHVAPKTDLLNDSSVNGVRMRSGMPSNAEGMVPPRAHSAKEINELQALEACSWLRAAGFPQYAQMYEDNQFPIDICTVQKDHTFLHPDSLQSLFRRLNTLNRCARMKFVDTAPRKSLHLDDSDDEEQCALSENWQFQRVSRRWSRVPSPTQVSNECCSHDQGALPKPAYHAPTPGRKYLTPEEAYSSSRDSVFLDEHSSPDSIRKPTARNSEQYLPLLPGGNSPGSSSGSGGTLSITSEEVLEKRLDIQKNLHRSGSDRIKEGAKSLLRRMESLKGKRKKKGQNRAHETSVCVNVNSGTDGSSCSSLTPSPLSTRQNQTHVPSPQDASDSSQGGTPQMDHHRKGFSTLFREEAENTAHSDSECPLFLVSEMWEDTSYNGIGFSEQQMRYKVPSEFQATSCSPFSSRNFKKKGKKENSYSASGTQASKKNHLSVSPHHAVAKLNNRASHYDNFPAPLAVFNNACVESLDRDLSEPGKGDRLTSGSDQACGESNEGEIIIINSERRDSGVGASLTRGSSNFYSPWHSFPLRSYSSKPRHSSIPITELSAPQILVLRKLSLLKLTGLMEKFSPSSRTGWSWVVPKFIRRIRTPDYKDKVVFGVPLLLVLQRTGQPLPLSIQNAILYLRKTALDSTGLFRKSGVRSRIQKLRNLNENNPEKVSYDDQQAYDVADMLKQYFRELPEALLTNKLSETFISIFQYIPEEYRLDAIQATILLMPDENREVLQALLSFLQEVCQHSGENQMTATNLAVCFAPSLFQLASPRSASASPRRRKTVGAPDLKELNENRAAYECLSCMIIYYKQLFSISGTVFCQTASPYMDACVPATIEELSYLVSKDTAGWRAYTNGCIQALLKEAKDKYKGWVTVSQIDGVDLCFKKSCDGHPLRLWKVSTEVEAPPTELLNRVLRERHVWDPTFLKWRVVQTLDKQADVFQYVSNFLPTHPPCDYCVIRSWRTELQKGACALIEASVDHPEAKLMVDGVRAVILASRILIEPCGSGKSRVTHISRVDTRGRSPEWYNRAYGHICTLNLMKLRDSFSHVRTEGPETKV